MEYDTEWNQTGIWDYFLCKILILTPNFPAGAAKGGL